MKDSCKDIINKIKLTVSKRGLLLVAGFVWLWAGGMLLSKGIGFLQEYPNEIFWKSIITLTTGVLFYQVLFTKISSKHIQRIKSLDTEKPCIFSFFNKKSYIMMFGMILLGVFLRKSQLVSTRHLPYIYVTMGIPLFISSIRFFIAFIHYHKKNDMNYTPKKPQILGRTVLTDIDIKEIMNFIDWRFFFHAWRLKGKFDKIDKAYESESYKSEWINSFSERNREKAEEAFSLYKDTIELLEKVIVEKSISINATVYLEQSYSHEEDIFIKNGDEFLAIPTLRQQKSSSDGFFYSLADFISPKDDYLGLFATTVVGAEEIAEKYKQENDEYYAILIKTVADRLAEATAEWLHWKVRTDFWGYSDEKSTPAELLKAKIIGIRPAVGYPSLPDQSIIFEFDKIISFNDIGISLTENGAIYPNSSVAGLYFAHPLAKYFNIGKIDDTQLKHYAKRRRMSPKQIEKWLIANL